jgi:hypothetical protein
VADLVLLVVVLVWLYLQDHPLVFPLGYMALLAVLCL